MADMNSRGKKGIAGAQVREALAAAVEKDPAGFVLEILERSGHPLPPERSEALTAAIAKIEDYRRQQPVFIPGKKEKGDNNTLDGTQLPPRPSE
jgi:hypothetical protein